MSPVKYALTCRLVRDALEEGFRDRRDRVELVLREIRARDEEPSREEIRFDDDAEQQRETEPGVPALLVACHPARHGSAPPPALDQDHVRDESREDERAEVDRVAEVEDSARSAVEEVSDGET
jgi:hypothetical protein